MTSDEFVLWLEGYLEGIHPMRPTLTQTSYILEKIKEIKNESYGPPFYCNYEGYISIPSIWNTGSANALGFVATTSITGSGTHTINYKNI